MSEEKEVKTEVTSIAKEEEKSGKRMELPSPEEVVNRAGHSFIQCKSRLNQIFPKLSSKAKLRAMNAILEIPIGGIPITLKTELEKLAFAYGQRMIADRFLITQHYIVKEKQRIDKEEAEKATKEILKTQRKENKNVKT